METTRQIDDRKKAARITAPCQKRGGRANMNSKAFNNHSGSLTGWCSESPAFGKLQNVGII